MNAHGSVRKFYLLVLITLFGFASNQAECQTPDNDFFEQQSTLKLAIDRGFERISKGVDDAQIDMLNRYYRPYSSKLQLSLRKLQNQDGGWGSQPGRESDAYSTATVLLILAQVDTEHKYRDAMAWDRNGLQYLLSTQKPDGSWHVSSRANPVQEFFDNGDPHESDQFISMQATAWSVAALSGAYHSEFWPLNVETTKRRE